jgi:hypothetical protein
MAPPQDSQRPYLPRAIRSSAARVSASSSAASSAALPPCTRTCSRPERCSSSLRQASVAKDVIRFSEPGQVQEECRRADPGCLRGHARLASAFQGLATFARCRHRSAGPRGACAGTRMAIRQGNVERPRHDDQASCSAPGIGGRAALLGGGLPPRLRRRPSRPCGRRARQREPLARPARPPGHRRNRSGLRADDGANPAGPFAIYDLCSEGEKKSRLIAALAVVGGNTWFLKMVGDASAVGASLADFMRLVEGLRADDTN